MRASREIDINHLIDLLTNQARLERKNEEHDKASGLELAARAIRGTLIDDLEPAEAFSRAIAEQEEVDFAAALKGITS
jgi:hypothetical protein